MADTLEGITWLGHDSFRINAPEGVIYIDPWKLPAGVPKAFASFAGPPRGVVLRRPRCGEPRTDRGWMSP